jgi:hypothetical protein
MNDTIHKALMVEVERAVRPVRTCQARKLRMREELLTHLTAIFEEEVTRCGDEQAALSQAKQRFGDPRELAHELQQTVPYINRVRCLLEIMGFRLSDSPMLFIVKGLLFIVIMLAILIPQLMIILALEGKMAEFGTRAYIVSVAIAINTVLWGMGFFYINRLRNTFFAERTRRFSARAAIDVLLCLCAFPFLAFSNYSILTGDLSASLAHARFACIFAPLAPVIFLLAAGQYDHEMRELEKWSKLEIDA